MGSRIQTFTEKRGMWACSMAREVQSMHGYGSGERNSPSSSIKISTLVSVSVCGVLLNKV